jgi:putative hydrolase of HD superfamily
MISERLKKQMEFMLEIDKLKNIYRQTYVLGENRKENDAEHSWHIAVMAFLLAEHANTPIDTLKVIKMVLLHDIVEIDAGDTYCYDAEGYKTKAQREEKAARRIFGLLPDNQSEEFYNLWREFEDCTTNDAKFAAVLDRMQPLTLNYCKNGVSWQEHGVYKYQVEKRNETSGDSSAALGELIQAILDDAEAKGWLKSES